MKFYGRDEQIKALNRFLDRSGLGVCLIYGRRRVGKSELIKHVLKSRNERKLYYECKETSELNNVESLAALISEEFHFPRPAFANLEALLNYLLDSSKNEPIILVLDEYPYLKNVIKGLDSILQALVDKYRDTGNFKFIICGSYIDIMKSLLEKENPLYGRVDFSIDLKPMDYFESANFYSTFSNEDKVKLYSVFGGIPYYNKMIDSGLSVMDNIIELIASDGARLENEVPMYLKSEISKIENANEVFESLAAGAMRYSDILSQSHVSSGPALADVLEKLARMELIKKEAPINDENNKRKSRYIVTDNFSMFYYRYIFRHLSQLNIINEDIFYSRFIEEDFETKYVPHVFEDICRQYLIRKNRIGEIDEPFEKIGRYWYDDPENHSNGEFDVVTFDRKGYIFYEAKFRKEPVSESLIRTEIEQVKSTGLNCYKYGFFLKSGFDIDENDMLKLISLNEMYK